MLEKGANANVVDCHGRSPLDDALDGEHQGCIVLLETHGAILHANKHTTKQIADVGLDDTAAKHANSNMEIDFDELEMIDRIGVGSFGEIYKCR